MTTTSSTSTNGLPEAWVERLFERMLLTYGRKFTDQWAAADTDALTAHWSQELAGFGGDELSRGLAALETRDWPPTLPEFKRMCRPPVDPLTAYYEAVAGAQERQAGNFGKWTHRAIYWAAMPLCADLLSQTYNQIKPRWERALAEELGKGEWPEIPRPMLALSSPPAQTREAAVKAIEKLVSMVGKPKADNRAWARRILEREQAGEKLTPVQVKMAREALAAPDMPLAAA
jgi:hypothetical protein